MPMRVPSAELALVLSTILLRVPLVGLGLLFMGNRRLTLAFPPYTILPMSSQRSLSRYPGSMRAKARSISKRELEFQLKIPAVISVNDHSEWLEVDMDDWLGSDRFPPLSSK